MEIIDSDHYKDLMLLLKIRTGFGSQYLIVFKWLRLFQIFYVLILEFPFYYSSLLLFLILCCDFLLFNSLWAYFPITIKITIIKPLSANSKICFMLQSVSVDCFFSPEWVTFPVSSDAKLFWTVTNILNILLWTLHAIILFQRIYVDLCCLFVLPSNWLVWTPTRNSVSWAAAQTLVQVLPLTW